MSDDWRYDADQALAMAEVRRVVKERRLPVTGVTAYGWWRFEFSMLAGAPVRVDLSSMALHEFGAVIERTLLAEATAEQRYMMRPRPGLSAGTHASRWKR